MIPILVELLLVIADGANFLDNEIFQLENDLIEAIPPARLAKSGVTRDGKGGVQKKTKKKVVILLQPLSIYLPTPIGVQKATFLIFFNTLK